MSAFVAAYDVPDNWWECPQCGLISTMPKMSPELVAHCPRCHHILWFMRRYPFELPIACALAGALFFCFALIAPFLEVSAYGHFQLAHIETGPVQLAEQGLGLVSFLVLAATVILPGVELSIMLVTLIGLETKSLPLALLRDIFRWYEPIKPWAMIDVYLLGFLVAYTRLTSLATVHLDTALYALIGLMLTMTAANAALDTEAVWRALDRAAQITQCSPKTKEFAENCLLIGCSCCGVINRALPGDNCRRCNEKLYPRKRNSISRTWALILAAAIFYIPANFYSVMDLTTLAGTKQYTIMGGIFELSQRGLWPLAILVFFASITIPILKLLLLAYMLVETQLRSAHHLLGRTIAFRIVHFIGRCSMIDIFMISILVAMVRFDQFSSVKADFGAVCFALVVVLTMSAVVSFDPRLMWDGHPDDHLPKPSQL